MKTIVSEKGQVTIPKQLRDRLGIRPGQVLEFRSDSKGRLIASKVPARDALDRVTGIIDLGRSTDEFLEELRGPVDDTGPAWSRPLTRTSCSYFPRWGAGCNAGAG